MNNSADILRNHSAESLGFAYVSGGLGRVTGRQVVLVSTNELRTKGTDDRDFVPSPSGVVS